MIPKPSVEAKRSLAFVSLDTHPANNSLVVTYEIQVSVCEREGSRRELVRRAKRDQFQIVLPTLEALKDATRSGERPTVGVNQLAQEILRKCPLLNSSADPQPTVEDIQLHLLYLMGRRQTNLEARPPSTSSQRLQRITSAGSWRRSAGSTRKPNNRPGRLLDANGEIDIFGSYLSGACELPWVLKSISNQLSELDLLLDKRHPLTNTSEQTLTGLLDDLYGNQAEQLRCLSSLRHLARLNTGLVELSSSRLLICALLRLLRDSSLPDIHLSILVLLGRLTSYSDTYELMFGKQDSIAQELELVRVLGLLLVSHDLDLVNGLDSTNQVPGDPSSVKLTLNSTLIIFHQLFMLTGGRRDSRLLASLVTELVKLNEASPSQSNASQPAASMLSVLEGMSKSLVRDFQLGLEPHIKLSLRLVGQLTRLIKILSVYREFVTTCARGTRSTEILVDLLGVLQLARSNPTRNQDYLCELLTLELELFGLINNLALDRRIKAKLMRKNLLKHSLRSLVIFLANIQQSRLIASSFSVVDQDMSLKLAALSRFNRSKVLLGPLKCLYEMSRLNQARAELLKSRIAIKCLLDYLQPASLQLLQALQDHHRQARQEQEDRMKLQSETTPQVWIANEYIFCIWINLSARHQPTAANHHELLFADCLSLATECLKAFSLLSKVDKLSTHLNTQVSLQAKLLHNFTLAPVSKRWLQINQIDRLTEMVTDWLACQLNENDPEYLLACEILHALSNLLSYNNIDLGTKASSSQLELAECLLARIDWTGGGGNVGISILQTVEDDLLLAALVYLERLAGTREICCHQPLVGSGWHRLLEFVPSNDRHLTESWIKVLLRFTNHGLFLRDLRSTAFPTDRLERLISRLVELLLWPGEGSPAGPAAQLLECLARIGSPAVNEQVEEFRFLGYNDKWIAAIRSSEPGIDLSTDLDINHRFQQLFRYNESASDDLTSRPSSSYRTDIDEEEEEPTSLDEELGAPDLSVIDAKSMIAHLAGVPANK